MPGGLPVDGFAAATSTAGGIPGEDASSAASAAASVTIVNIDVSSLVVPVTQTSSSGASVAAPVDLSKIVDTTPPTITLQGNAYVQVLESTTYTDASVLVYDNIDGYSVVPRTTIKLCSKPDGVDITQALPTDHYPVSCSSTPYGLVNTTEPLDDQHAYLLSYGAKDAAGNVALPVRRWVVVTARWVLADRPQCMHSDFGD